jgi:hypothetical protein
MSPNHVNTDPHGVKVGARRTNYRPKRPIRPSRLVAEELSVVPSIRNYCFHSAVPNFRDPVELLLVVLASFVSGRKPDK